jgi:hypothetical protein
MRIIYFFLSQLEKCSIGKKREKSLLPEAKKRTVLVDTVLAEQGR